MIIKIKVYPNSGKQEVIKITDEGYMVYLKSDTENNKANMELIKLLSKYFNTHDIKIIRGKTSRKKEVSINGNKI